MLSICVPSHRHRAETEGQFSQVKAELACDLAQRDVYIKPGYVSKQATLPHLRVIGTCGHSGSGSCSNARSDL